MRVVISGGGTGGHIFPAIAIADEIKRQYPQAAILFVGAKGKMEMTKVPAAGYEIKGLWISGIQRKLTTRNLTFPFKLLSSLLAARKIIKRFAPDIAIGVGGYASGPTLYMAGRMGIPTLIQEQNSYPGITNKLLASRVGAVCVAYSRMDRWFPNDRIYHTGNPVRASIIETQHDRATAVAAMGMDPNKETIFICGGSLGARSINKALAEAYEDIAMRSDVNIIWQVGKLYIGEYSQHKIASLDHVQILAFIEDMTMAYAAADVIVGRAGALTISELQVVGKAAILVPSPNVSEDHQTKNAMALVDREAALLLPDEEVGTKISRSMYDLLGNLRLRHRLEKNISAMAKRNATGEIVKHVSRLVKV